MKKRRLRSAAGQGLWAVVLLAATATTASAQICRLERTEFRQIKDMPKVRQEACSFGDEGKQGQLRITRLRLDENLAGTFAKQTPLPELASILDTNAVVRNEVYATVADLYSRFAHKTKYDAKAIQLSLAVQDPKVGPTDDPDTETGDSEPIPANPQAKGPRTIWSITYPFGDNSLLPLYDESAVKTILLTQKMPQGFHQSYYGCVRTGAGEKKDPLLDDDDKPIPVRQANPAACMSLWRDLTLGDLPEVQRALAVYFSRYHSQSPTTVRQEFDWQSASQRFKSLFEFYKTVGKNGLPLGFLAVDMDINNLGCGFSELINLTNRPLALDVAVIANTSSDDVVIESFFGNVDRQNSLRLVGARNSSSEDLAFPPVTLKAGAEIIVPLRIVFADDDGKSDEESLADQTNYFRALQGTPENYVFKGTVYPRTLFEDIKKRTGEGAVTIEKKREAFQPPTVREHGDLVYGSDIVLTGLLVNLKKYSLEGRAPSSLSLVGYSDDRGALPSTLFLQNPEDGASCPILYYWDQTQSDWVRHGKIIDKAQNADRETSELVDLPAVTSRFRLAEEEPEATYIRRVDLILTLKNGQQMILAPKENALHSQSEKVFEIPPYSSTDFSFDIPNDATRIGIIKSQVRVTGYYRRLSAMLLSGILQEVHKSSPAQCVGAGAQSACPIVYK